MSQRVQAVRKEAVLAIRAGRAAQGIALLERALRDDPLSGEILADLAVAYQKTGQPGQADQHFARAAGLAPDNTSILNAYALFLMEEGRFDKAEPLLKQAETLEPGNPEVRNNLGILYFKKGDFEKAEKSFLEVIRLRPEWPMGYANLGDTLKDTRPEAAEKAYRQAVTVKPDHAYSWARLGEIYFDLDRESESLDCLRHAIELNPKAREPWIRLVQLLEVKGKLEEASDTLDKALKIFEAPGLVIMKSKLLRRRNKSGEAIAFLEKYRPAFAGPSPGKSAYAYFFELGQVYDRENQIDAAFDAFTAANAIQDKL